MDISARKPVNGEILDLPAWDYQSAYWLSQNALDERGSYLKTRAYYERFYNSLDSYDNLSYSTQNTPKSFRQLPIDDRSSGAIRGAG